MWLSGLLKPYFYTYVFEFDIVALAMIIALFDILFQISVNKVVINQLSFNILLLILIFYLWIVLTFTYSPSDTYKYEKSGNLIANLIFFLYPLYIRKIDFNIIIRLYSIIILPLAVFSIYMMSIVWKIESDATNTFQEMGFNYLALGFHLGVLLLLLIYFKKHIYLIAITFLLLLGSAARGSIIFIFLILGISYIRKLFSIKITARELIYAGIGIGFSIILLITFYDDFSPLFERTILRFQSMESGVDNSVTVRKELMKFAFYQPFDSYITIIFGNGIGSFGVILNQIDARAYPHNVFLEIFFELGLIGLGSFLSILIFIFVKFPINKGIFFTLFLFALLDSLKSSSLVDLWLLFAFIGGIVANQKSVKRLIKRNYSLSQKSNSPLFKSSIQLDLRHNKD